MYSVNIEIHTYNYMYMDAHLHNYVTMYLVNPYSHFVDCWMNKGNKTAPEGAQRCFYNYQKG